MGILATPVRGDFGQAQGRQHAVAGAGPTAVDGRPISVG